MDKYIVSARKYRPATFASVVGQQALTSTLKNAIATNRLAHAYLFCGSRGVGKTSCARIFAKTINCTSPTADGEPCNRCESCRSFNEGRSLNIIELDAASNNGVDDMRALVEQVQVPPVLGKYRVFIIDEVHMLSSAAFNAFLKTLEEPPSYVIFILATTEKHKIIPTILSRCQIYDFNRITINDMVNHLEYVAGQEGISAERPALTVIARKADGAMRDALSIFDQVAASCRGNITYRGTIDNLNFLDTSYYSRLLEAFGKCDVPRALLIYKEVRDRGFDSQFFVNGLADYLRDLMVARDPSTLPLLDTDAETAARMAADAAQLPPEFYYKAMSLCNSADLNYRQATNKTFLVELLLIRLCQLLSPSPIFDDGDGEGLMPIAAAAGEAAAVVTPSTPAAAAVRAAPAVAAAAPPAAVRTPGHAAARRRSDMPAHSLRDLMSSELTAAPVAASGVQASDPGLESLRRCEPYDPAELQRLWREFMNGHERERLLYHAMRASEPVAAGDDRYTVTVENQVQLEKIQEALPAIYAMLRDGLRNDNITIDIQVNAGEGKPATWSDRQIQQHLYATNPVLAELARVLKFTLE